MKRYSLLFAICVTLLRPGLQIVDAFPIHPAGVHAVRQPLSEPSGAPEFDGSLLAAALSATHAFSGGFGPPPNDGSGLQGSDP